MASAGRHAALGIAVGVSRPSSLQPIGAQQAGPRLVERGRDPLLDRVLADAANQPIADSQQSREDEADLSTSRWTTIRVMSQLLVITGPIASGKSTLARAVANRAIDAGLLVAECDLDDVARMARAGDGTNEVLWSEAMRPFAALVSGWLQTSIDLVIAHGSLYTASDVAALTSELPTSVAVNLVLLQVSIDAALDRAGADPTRGISAEPSFLRSQHLRFAERLAETPTLFAQTIDTDTVTNTAATEKVFALLTSR